MKRCSFVAPPSGETYRLKAILPTLTEVKRAIAPLGQLLVVRRDQDDRAVVAAIALQQISDNCAGIAIQITRRFVGQYQRGVMHQPASESDPLVFATRQMADRIARAIGQTHVVQGGDRAFARYLPSETSDNQGHRYIFPRGQIR